MIADLDICQCSYLGLSEKNTTNRGEGQTKSRKELADNRGWHAKHTRPYTL